MSSSFLISYVLLWLLVIAESVMLLVLLRELGRVYAGQAASIAGDGIRLGKPLPSVSVATVDGSRALDDVIGYQRMTLLLFVSSACPACPDAVAAVNHYRRRENAVGVVLVTRTESLSAYADGARTTVVGIDEEVARKQLKVRATPFAMLVDQFGIVRAKGIVNRQQHVEELVESARADDSNNDGATVEMPQRRSFRPRSEEEIPNARRL